MTDGPSVVSTVVAHTCHIPSTFADFPKNVYFFNLIMDERNNGARTFAVTLFNALTDVYNTAIERVWRCYWFSYLWDADNYDKSPVGSVTVFKNNANNKLTKILDCVTTINVNHVRRNEQ